MTPETSEITRLVALEGIDPLSLFGRNDSNLRLVEKVGTRKKEPASPGKNR